jgi:uncharacterized lipoprotein YajG
MSDLYTELEGALAAMLRGCAGMASVKIIETSVRECLFSGDKLSKGFRAGELPAINVTAQLKPSKSRPFSAGEKEYEIPVSIVIVTRAQTPKEALAKVYALQNAAEGVLDQARKSGNPLGTNVFVVGDVTGDAAPVLDPPAAFAVCTLEATVLKVVEL